MFEGELWQYEKDENGEFTILVKKSKNLFVDDGKEAALDALFGYRGGRSKADWWNSENRYIGYGTCCFNNESFERASGMNAIPSGSECDYPVETTMFVSPEDSFLSREVGNRTGVTPTRIDQSVELSAVINVPGDIPAGTLVREFAIFAAMQGPFQDPSNFDSQKSRVMICRTVNVGTGYFGASGSSCVSVASGASGATLCYYDEPWIASGDRKLYWKFGEI